MGVPMHAIFEKLHRFFNAHWHLAVLDLQKGLWTVEAKTQNIGYLKAQNAAGRHILIQPGHQERYLLADDLTWKTVCRQHRYPHCCWKPGRMVVETSPANFQVWIRCAKLLSLDQKRAVLKRLKSDPGADPNNRFGRCPGFRNRKNQYRSPEGLYPLCRLIWIDWSSDAHIPDHLLVPPTAGAAKALAPLPLGGAVCHKSFPLRAQYRRQSESQTDFAFALALIRMDAADSLIRCLILQQRSCWQHHRGQNRINAYLDRTIAKARAVINNG
jgi:hypothetical protein